MHQHFRYACSRCGNVMQCRCPGARTDVEVDACPDCVPGTRLPGPLRLPNGRRRNSGRKSFITDFGESPVLQADDGSKITLSRYGVWKWNGRKHEVVDTGDDLDALQRKHGISEPPLPLRGPSRNAGEAELPAIRGSMLPALPAQPLAPGEWLPPRVSWDLMLSPRTQQFVYMPEGVQENAKITTTLGSLLTRSGIANVNAWEDLLAACGTRARLFVTDRWGERYEVKEVLFDYGGESGRLVVRHIGARSRQGDLEIDIHKAVGYMLPIVVYKPR